MAGCSSSTGLLGSLLLATLTLHLEACTVVELDASGFANNVMTLLHATPMFLRQNGTLFVDNADFHYKCSQDGGWHDFFSGEEQLVPWSSTKEGARGEACARFNRQRIDDLMYNAVRTKPDLLDFIGIKQVWKLRPWVQEFVDEQLEELAQLPRPTIGFHIRGGDMLYQDKYLKRAPTTPMDAVRTFAQTFPLVRGGTCVMVGDEHAKVTEAAKAAERHLKCKVFRSSPFWRKEGFSQEMHNKEGLNVKCGGTVKLLVDLELLAHSDYLVASDHSQWSRLLQYIRYIIYGHDRSSFVDASAEHGDLFSVIRKYIRPNAFVVHNKPPAKPDAAPKKKKKKKKGKVVVSTPAPETIGDAEEEAEDEY